MELNNEILSDVTVFGKYAKYLKDKQRRENWDELVTRNKDMHIRKYPIAEKLINTAYKFVYDKKVLPSMRSLQFGGLPIELAHNRIYNCAYLPMEHIDSFSETMFLLLGGSGVGYSVQMRHVKQLPRVIGTQDGTRKYSANDSIEGWADCIKVLVEAHFLGKLKPVFDLRGIREKGAELVTTGGKAPGPEPLRACLQVIEECLEGSRGRYLSPLEVHDIVCHIADSVMAGGIRRAALISLFDRSDLDMLECKSGDWWKDNGQRGRANNSAVLPRHEVTQGEFMELMKRVQDSGSGEPGVYWTSNVDWGTNPCCEIALQPYQFCNLCEINASDVVSQTDLNNRARAAAIIGTLQAGYTDFHYLRPIWKQTTEADALIGVGMTGIGSGKVLDLDLEAAANEVIRANGWVADLIGINRAARTTTVKPSGTSSLVVGSSSGIHAWHNTYYLRRMRVGYNEPLFKYMVDKMPRLVEPDELNPSQAVLSFPQKAPTGAIIRTEPLQELLERVRRFNLEWVRTGHTTGDNTHNVSCTVSVKDDEWDEVSSWMWDNRNDYNGIAVLPYDGGTYIQAPFEDITEAEYEDLEKHLLTIDLTEVHEADDNTDVAQEAACSGGACEK